MANSSESIGGVFFKNNFFKDDDDDVKYGPISQIDSPQALSNRGVFYIHLYC